MNRGPIEAPDIEAIRVFISYSHDSPDHEDRVLVLANRLRRDGIECSVDQYIDNPDEGWQRWMRNQIRLARFILVVGTDTYQSRFYGLDEPGRGLGANREALTIDLEIYNNNGRNAKFIPVVFSPDNRQYIPDILQPYTNYILEDETGYDALYKRLRGIPPHEQPQLGTLRPLIALEREHDFAAEDRRPKTVQEYGRDAVRLLGPYMVVMPEMITQMREGDGRFNEEAWRENILTLAQKLEAANTEILAYTGVPLEATEAHVALRETASHMDRVSALLRYALYERNMELIGDSTQELDIVASLMNEYWLPEVQTLQTAHPTTVAITCNLAPYDNVSVYFRFDNIQEQVAAAEEMIAEVANEVDRQEAKARLLTFLARTVVGFHNWHVTDRRGIPVPTPNPRQPSTYLPLLKDDQAGALLQWILADGLRAAIQELEHQQMN